MSKKKLKLFYDSRAGMQVLGCLMKDITLLKNRKYKIAIDDFHENMHRHIFAAIYNLSLEDIEEIKPMDIFNYLLSVSPHHHKLVFEDNDGLQWFDEVDELTSLGNFEYNYNRLRKYSLLRRYVNEGQNVDDILDPTEIDPDIIQEQQRNFNKMTLQDIMTHYNAKSVAIRNDFTDMGDVVYRKAGDNSLEIKEDLKNMPSYGLLFNTNLYNTVIRGAQRTKFILRSGGTGAGKSRTALAEMCQLGAVELWDEKEGGFVKNPNNPNGDLSMVYVGTELELDKEVEIIMWATISGVPTEVILDNSYTVDQEERVDYAIDILTRSKFHLYDDANYSITKLKEYCETHINNGENLYGLFLDYICITGAIITEFQEIRKGIATREDQIYLWMSTELKNIAKNYNIYVGSSTQLNAKATNGEEKNAGMIRGSYAIADKADIAAISVEPNARELEKIKEILKKRKKFNQTHPNLITHIFKSRGTKYKLVRIYQYANLGTMQIEDLFVTDYDFKLLDVIPTIKKPLDE